MQNIDQFVDTVRSIYILQTYKDLIEIVHETS